VQGLVALELLLLRDATDTSVLRLTPGRTLSARVVAPQMPDALGRLAIAGSTVEASLPAHLQAGDEVRLAVREASPEHLTLTLIPPPSAAPASVPLPGGGRVQVSERNARDGADEQPQVVSLKLRYDAPKLGSVDLHFQLAPWGLSLSVSGTEGEGLALMRAHLDELRAALRDATPTSAVELRSRRDLVRYA
jgi:hypothetical protein